MRQLFRIINILGWPLWLKLSAAFILAILVPVVLILLVIQSSLSAVSTQTMQNQLTDYGQREFKAITDVLAQSQSTVTTFVNLPSYSSEILQLFEKTTTKSTAETADTSDLQRLPLALQSLVIGSQTFQKIQLISANGRLLIDVDATQIVTGSSDASNDPAYKQATAGLIQKRDRTLSVFNPNNPTIAFTQAIRNKDSDALGFVVTSLNVNAIVQSTLGKTDPLLPFYSYLITFGQSPILLTRAEMQDVAETSVSSKSVAIERAFRGGNGSSIYRLAGQDTEVIGYYAGIPNPNNPDAILFALVAEVRTDSISTSLDNYLGAGRPFVIGVGLLLLLLVLVILFNEMISPPLGHLRRAIQALTSGRFDEPVPAAGRGDEIGTLSSAFVDMRDHVRSLLDDLEKRVAARTRDINATQEISRFAATQRNLQILMDQVVELLVSQFSNIYHAQIFLLDPDRSYAVLRASSGEAGKNLLARGHRLAIGSVSLVGQAVGQRQIMIARDTSASQIFRRNEFLPETRAELSIPLVVGNQVIGALDVQSTSRNAFAEDEINILRAMADQIALAIENTRLYQESVRRLEEIERTNRRSTLQTWQEYVYGQRQRQLSSQAGVTTGNDLSELRRRAIAQNKVVMGEITSHQTIPIAVPIVLRGQTLGAVEWELPVNDVSESKLQLAQELANRLAVSLENARLFQESQRATERERIVNSIAAKLTPQTEISEILQTAVREVGQALRAPQVSIRLHRPDKVDGNGSSNGDSAEYHNGHS